MNAPRTGCMLPEQTHRLAPPKVKARKDGTARPAKPPPPPMTDEKVKANWQGKSKEELVDLPSWIPADVRAHPRAYLVPARESQKSLKTQAYHQAHSNAQSTSSGMKRPRENPSTSESPSLFLPPPPFPRPAAEMGSGECVSSTWDWKNSVWKMTYQSGASVTLAAQVLVAAPQRRPEAQNEPRQKRPRYDSQPAQQRY